MGQIITVEGKIPEDFPEVFREQKNREIGESVIRKRLGLSPEDEVNIIIKE